MAIDTAAKRRWIVSVFPVADGTLSRADIGQLLDIYPGISLGEPVVAEDDFGRRRRVVAAMYQGSFASFVLFMLGQ